MLYADHWHEGQGDGSSAANPPALVAVNQDRSTVDPSQAMPPGVFISPGNRGWWQPDFYDAVQPLAMVLASDAFLRTVAPGGWGTANIGGPWTVAPSSTPSLFSVNNTAGVIALDTTGNVQAVELLAAAATTASIQFDMSLSALPSAGNFVFVFAWFRVSGGGGSFYRIGVFVDSAGVVCLRGESVLGSPATTATLFPDSTPSGMAPLQPATFLTVGAALSSSNTTNVQAKTFPAGSADPGWQITGFDANNVGPQVTGPIGLRVASTLLNGVAGSADPITVTIDNFLADNI